MASQAYPERDSPERNSVGNMEEEDLFTKCKLFTKFNKI